MSTVQVRATRRLWAARLLGAGAAAVLGQFAVDMPVGYFGGAVQMTRFGAAFVVATVMAALLAAAVFLGGYRAARGLTAGVLLFNLLLFVPPIVVDPVVALAVVLWHVYMLARLLFPLGPLRLRSERPEADPASARLERWMQVNRLAVQHILGVSVVLTIAVVGFQIGHHPPALTVCLVMSLVAVAVSIRFIRLAFRSGARFLPGLATLLVLSVVSALKPDLALAWLAVYQVSILAVLLARSSTVADLATHFNRRPAVLAVVSFAVLIALGSLFLSFPAASSSGRPVHPVDALFTATSAVCVTGLTVLETPTDFSLFGQTVILFLIQVGGLNIMVLYAFTALLLGRNLGLRSEQALGEVLDLKVARTAGQVVVFIVAVALLIELAGAGILTGTYLAAGRSMGSAVWLGVFHAVSAFCNAGFSLHSDSLVGFQRHPLVLGTMMVLIVLGGLGFNTLATTWGTLRRRQRGPVSVQVKVVLTTTFILVILGAAWFLLAEWSRSLAGLSAGHKLLNALFQSVTMRTAGFNTVDPRLFHGSTVVLAMAWMFIGASPGGTGGGVKTTTAAVLVGAIPALTRGRAQVVLFRRTVPLEVVYRATAITVVAALIGFGGTAVLAATQQGRLDVLVFEVLSALGTVGLSLGATTTLDVVGKVVITGIMFVGRLGPLTMVLLLARAAVGRIAYPDARLMVG